VAQLAGGDLRLAAELASAGHRAAVGSGARLPAGGWAALAGLVAASRGRAGVAEPTLREACALLDRDDRTGMVRLCLAGLAATAALTGGDPGAAGWLGAADRRRGPAARLYAPWVEQWRARAVATPAAAGRAAGLARAIGLPTVELSALYDVVRLGGGRPDRLAVRAADLANPLARATALAAEGMDRRDADALAEATGAFDRLGHDLLAAETATAAGQAFRRTGRRASARAFAERAATLRAACGGVRTPLLDVDGVVGVLTPREREVTLLAVGLTSPQIARRLGLSPRTVSNNLTRAYAKLGVAGRDELRALLG
jgi:DNA-binding CsgD family transcriptional regulator